MSYVCIVLYKQVIYHRIMSKIIKTISTKVKFLRTQKGLSQAKLAELSGVHEKTIMSVESGKHSITIDVIEKICKVFGIGVYELLLPAKSTINTRMQLDARQELLNMQNSINKLLENIE